MHGAMNFKLLFVLTRTLHVRNFFTPFVNCTVS